MTAQSVELSTPPHLRETGAAETEPTFRGLGARRTDPVTSHLGDQDVEPRRASQRRRLLNAYLNHEAGLTNHEAGEIAHLFQADGSYPARRCSELLRDGCIEVVTDEDGNPLLRVNSYSGSKQRVCRITGKGRSELLSTEPLD